MARLEQLNIKGIVDKVATDDNQVGNVYAASGYYGIDMVYVTLKKGIRLSRGDYLFVKDSDGLPIVYQVVSPKWFRPYYDFMESLIAAGSPIRDEYGQRYRCSCVIVGKIDSNGEISQVSVPPAPLTNVYKCNEEIVRLVTEPLDDWKIKLGKNPETGLDIYVALEPLVRQSLLITGAQGTGKTTALMTIIVRCIRAKPRLKFAIMDWTGEFKALSKINEIVVNTLPWYKVAYGYLIKDPYSLLDELKDHPLIGERRSYVYRTLERLLLLLKMGETFPSKRSLRGKVNEAVEEISSKRQDQEEISAKVTQVIDECDAIMEDSPKKSDIIKEKDIVEHVKANDITIIDFTKDTPRLPMDIEFKTKIASYIAGVLWEAARSKDISCVLVSDEAHRVCPERLYGETDPIWIRLATEGGRNGIPFWLVARRLSLVTKSVTVESQQNFISFNTEDIDRRRIAEDLGSTFAEMLGTLPRGEAIVKSMGFRIPGQAIHVKFDVEVEPATGPKLRERFKAQSRNAKTVRNQ